MIILSEVGLRLLRLQRTAGQGKYNPEDSPGQNVAWVAHLDALIEKIGPDGSSAADQGIARLK